MAIKQGDTVIRQIEVGKTPHEISAKYLGDYTYEEINEELINRLQGYSGSSVPYDPFIKLDWIPDNSNINDNMNVLCPQLADGKTDGQTNAFVSDKKIGHFRSYSSNGIACLDIKVDVLSWANAKNKEIFMQTVSGPVTLKDNNINLYWVNGVPGSGPGHYYRLSKREYGAGNETRTWSEWKPVNNSYIELLQSKVHHQLTPPYYYSNPQLDIEAGDNNIYCLGYVGTLKNINVNGDYILIDSISVYVRENGNEKSLDTPVWCRLLKYVNNTWETIYQSTESRTIRAITPETLFSFKMKAIDENNDSKKLIRRNDKIAIVYVNSEDAQVELGFKSITKTGGLKETLSNNNTLQGWSPAFVIGYLSKDTEQTFDGDIHIKNKTTITTNIDAGELKVRHYGTEKGFIIRTNNKGANANASIFPLEILTTNNLESYQYNFPQQNGDIILFKNVTHSELVGLKNGSKLVPGGIYRITDYSVTFEDTSILSAGNHQFDIIVQALAKNVLNENAKACLHDNDTYFANAKINAWELKYCLDNDVSRFAWASTGGKGIIYYMKDEWGNEASYDFKNFKFVSDGKAYYTFSYIKNNIIYDATIKTKIVRNNTLLPSYDTSNGSMTLGFNIFKLTINSFQKLCVSNYIGENCTHNTFGTGCSCNVLNAFCYKNKFGDECQYNTLEEYCEDNIFGNQNQSNTFGVNCCENEFGNTVLRVTFGNKCKKNKLGDSCELITFSDRCESNKFGNQCRANTFGNECSLNEFGDECYSNTFANGCESNKFGIKCYSNTFGDYCKSNEFISNCYSNLFNDMCSSNNFGNKCNHNIFDNYCVSNRFGTQCYYNNFSINSSNNMMGEGCRNNNFAQNCKYNIIGNNGLLISFGVGCEYNTLGNNYQSITFGTVCKYNIFTLHNGGETLIPEKNIPTLPTTPTNEKVYDSDYSPIDRVRYITFGDAVQYNVFYTRTATDDSHYLQMYNVDSYILNNRYKPETSNKPIELKSGLQASYITKIARNSSGHIKQYCETDLIK